jgi:hypothetical protein
MTCMFSPRSSIMSRAAESTSNSGWPGSVTALDCGGPPSFFAERASGVCAAVLDLESAAFNSSGDKKRRESGTAVVRTILALKYGLISSDQITTFWPGIEGLTRLS